MKFNRKKFFDGFKKHFDSSLDQSQVDGIEFLLTSFEKEPLWKDVRHIAYALATIYHETAASMQPVEEGYYLGSPTRVKNFQKTLRYYPYFGRGYVQLTWERNYVKAGKALGVDFVKNPKLVMQPDYSFQILTRGMFEGWFTGKKLSTYIHGTVCDYVNARKIINGTDKAGLIAGYARLFEKLLRDSGSPSDRTAVPPADSSSLESETADAPETPTTTEVTQTADTIINEESLVDKANGLGDKFQSFQGVLDKFGFSIADAKRSIGTVLLTWGKALFAMIMTALGVFLNHWELFVIAGLLLILAYLVWDRSGKRVAEAKAGMPVEVAKEMIKQDK